MFRVKVKSHPPPRYRELLRHGALAAALLAAAALGGCAGADSYAGARVFAVQEKYDWQSCEQLTGLRNASAKRIEEVTKLMQVASRDSGGGLVNTAVHEPNLAAARADRRMIEEAMEHKKCHTAG